MKDGKREGRKGEKRKRSKTEKADYGNRKKEGKINEHKQYN